MPFKKGYTPSEEHRKKLRANHKGMKGKRHTKETRELLSKQKQGDNNPAKRPEVRKKISIAKKGKKLSEEHKKKISIGNMGNKLSSEHKLRISKAQKGRKHTKEHIEKCRESRKGFKHSEETKEKMRKHHPWNKGKVGVYTEEQIKVLRTKRLEQKNVMIDTSIELKVKEQLEKENIDFVHPFNLGNRFQCDFYLPSLNLIIECDGDYWHSREDMKRRDRAKDAYAKKCGYRLVRIKEHEIKTNNFNICKIINADVQGAYNIIKKAIPKAFARVEADEIEGVGLHPLRYHI
jgi:very-short-patch-repair endonuclease